MTDSKIDLLRHTLATLAYRGGKAVRNAPEDFGEFRVGPTTRTPVEILAHTGDLLEWAVWLADGEHRWHDSEPLPWAEEVDRFFRLLERLDARLADASPLSEEWGATGVFQGPIADALTHVGQINLLRRLAGAPVMGENYAMAEIVVGRVGRDQADPRREFE